MVAWLSLRYSKIVSIPIYISSVFKTEAGYMGAIPCTIEMACFDSVFSVAGELQILLIYVFLYTFSSTLFGWR